SPGSRGATRKAVAAKTRNGARSQRLQRRTKGRRRGRVAVWPATKSDGQNQPRVMTAGMAPMTTFEAPRSAAKAGRIVDVELTDSPLMNREKSAPRARKVWRTSAPTIASLSAAGDAAESAGMAGPA